MTPLLTETDDQLWQRSRRGDREAFGQIVERYQNLICSLAYSACGSLARSEDLAQETFIAAWLAPDDLHDPTKLRSWLCGIVRNRAANAARRERRRGGAAESLDVVEELHGTEPDPATQVVSNEEATLLWRTLARLPGLYREPMVLFYRQGESVSDVAHSLDLSEVTVKQRLSRGRAMLRSELATVVESTLTRTRPTAAFMVGVLSALPAVAPPKAAASIAVSVASGQAAGAAKSLLSSLGGWALIGPAIGLIVGLFGARAAAATARSEEERASIRRHTRRIVVFAWGMSIGLVLVLSQAGKLYTASALWLVIGIFAWMGSLVGILVWLSTRLERDVARIRLANGTAGDRCAPLRDPVDGSFAFRSKTEFLGLPLVAISLGRAAALQGRRAVGWIAIGDVAVSPLLALGGIAVGPVAVGALTFGVLSLSLWGAAVGVLAVGGIALGWLAFGFGALGWKAAGGAAAVARDYAIGAYVVAGEANSEAAKAWFAAQWFATPVQWFAYNAHWILVVLALVVIAASAWRARKRSRRSATNA